MVSQPNGYPCHGCCTSLQKSLLITRYEQNHYHVDEFFIGFR
jgi:hypothetical protein